MHSDGHLYFFYTAAVSLEDGEFEVPAGDDVVDLGNVPGYFQDEAGEAVAFAFYLVEGVDGQVHDLTDIVEHGPALENIATVIEAAIGGFFVVELIADVADDLFEDIFERDDAAGAAEFVDDNGKMDLLLLEFLQEVFDQLVFVYEVDRPDKGMPVKAIGLAEGTDEVAALDGASELVEAAFIHGQAGVVQVLYFLLQLAEAEVIADAANIQAGPHDLPDGDAAELDDAFEDISFIFGGFVPDGLIDLVAKLLELLSRLFATKEALERLGLVYGPATYAAEEQVDELDDPGGIVGELEVILCRPDLWHHFPEKDHDESDQDHLYEEQEPEVLFWQDHLVDEEVGEDDDRDIDDAVGDEQGGEQGLRLFEQGHDTFPGNILLGLQDIDILVSKREKSDL